MVAIRDAKEIERKVMPEFSEIEDILLQLAGLD